jgi:hypothetical protein
MAAAINVRESLGVDPTAIHVPVVRNRTTMHCLLRLRLDLQTATRKYTGMGDVPLAAIVSGGQPSFI